MLRYLPEAPIVVVHGDERNMKVTEPIDVYLADKLFQLTSNDLPGPGLDGGRYRAALAGKTMVVFGGSYGIGADIAALASGFGADVFTFSRSSTNTHVERRDDIAAAARAGDRGDRPGRLRGQHRRGAAARRRCSRPARRRSTPRPRSTTWRPIFIAQEFYPHLRETQGSLLLFTSSSYTRGRSGYSLYSSAKAATVNLTQALADEWAERPGAGQLRQPRAHRDPDAHEGVRRRSRPARCSTPRSWPAPRWTC